MRIGQSRDGERNSTYPERKSTDQSGLTQGHPNVASLIVRAEFRHDSGALELLKKQPIRWNVRHMRSAKPRVSDGFVVAAELPEELPRCIEVYIVRYNSERDDEIRNHTPVNQLVNLIEVVVDFVVPGKHSCGCEPLFIGGRKVQFDLLRNCLFRAIRNGWGREKCVQFEAVQD